MSQIRLRSQDYTRQLVMKINIFTLFNNSLLHAKQRKAGPKINHPVNNCFELKQTPLSDIPFKIIHDTTNLKNLAKFY